MSRAPTITWTDAEWQAATSAAVDHKLQNPHSSWTRSINEGQAGTIKPARRRVFKAINRPPVETYLLKLLAARQAGKPEPEYPGLAATPGRAPTPRPAPPPPPKPAPKTPRATGRQGAPGVHWYAAERLAIQAAAAALKKRPEWSLRHSAAILTEAQVIALPEARRKATEPVTPSIRKLLFLIDAMPAAAPDEAPPAPEPSPPPAMAPLPAAMQSLISAPVQTSAGDTILQALVTVLHTALESDRGQLALASALELAMGPELRKFKGLIDALPAAPPAPAPPEAQAPAEPEDPAPPPRHNPQPRADELHAVHERPRIALYGLIAGQPAWITEQYGDRLDCRFLGPSDDMKHIKDAARSAAAVVMALNMVKTLHVRVLKDTARKYVQCSGTASDLKRVLDQLVHDLKATPVGKRRGADESMPSHVRHDSMLHHPSMIT